MFKKILIILSLSVLLFTPFAYVKAEDTGYTLKDINIEPDNIPDVFKKDKPDYTPTGLSIKIAELVTFLLDIAGGVAVFFIVFSGFRYTISIGDTEQSGNAKKALTWAILGLVVVILSYAIVQNIINMLVSIPPQEITGP